MKLLKTKIGIQNNSQTLLIFAVQNSSDFSDLHESRTGNFELDRLVLGRLGTGSGVLLRGTSDISMISLLLPGFFDIFVEIMP
jgi:hypothetical protein